MRLIFHEVYVLPHGLLVNELDGVPETTQCLRLEGAQSVNGREVEGAQNAVGDLLWIRLLRAFAERSRIAVLQCPGVVDTVASPLPQDVQALAVDMSHAPVPELSRLRLLGKAVRVVSEDHLVPSSTPKFNLYGVYDLAGRVVYPQLLHRDNHAVFLQPGVCRVTQRRQPLQHRRGHGEKVLSLIHI